MRTLILTTLALIAFAANSVLCRMALLRASIDPVTFSIVRVLAGACTLWIISRLLSGKSAWLGGSWTSALVLVIYALPFAFAYTRLPAGTGALLLFGSVQVTMLAWALAMGERPGREQWLGIATAVAGLIYLVLPGVAAPPAVGAMLMVVAGVFWAIYSLRGRGPANPLGDTTGNFMRACPLIVAAGVPFASQLYGRPYGVALAIGSGSLTTAVGYVIWYSALKGLTATRAAVVQLAVPVIAAAGGVIFLGERLSQRLVLSAVAILGGIGLAVLGWNSRKG